MIAAAQSLAAHAAPQDDAEPVVAARALVKTYGPRRAVDGLSFAIARGTAFGLLGPNGAGKTTIMRLIACRTPLTAGELAVLGLDARRDARRIRAQLGVVPQENNLDPDLCVLQNMLAYARYFHLPRELARARALHWLCFVGLHDRHEARIETLSGGMRRRLVIARALINEPQLLILDEPTTGLDPHVRQQIWQQLEALRQTRRLTLLISTHYMDEAERLCDQLVIINRGRLVASGNPRQLIAAHLPPYVLEARAAELDPLPAVPHDLRRETRPGAHLYFAHDPARLLPLMRHYTERRALIRATNLEDLFLQLVGPPSDS